MRIPAAANIESRDGTVTKGARVVNGIIEGGEDSNVRKRPGLQDYGLTRVGTAQLLEGWNGVRTVTGDYLNSGFAPAVGYTNNTTWNSADKAAGITLSNGDLTATATAGLSGVRSSFNLSAGIWYYEFTIVTANNISVGFASSTQSLAFGGTQRYIMYSAGIGQIYYIGGNAAVAASIAGDVIGLLYEADAGTVSFYRNGTFLASYSGIQIPDAPLYAITGSIVAPAGGAGTANFAGPFTYLPAAQSTALVVTQTNLPFSSAYTNSTASTQYMMIKNAQFAWTVVLSGTPTKVTNANYPGNYATPRRTVPGIVYLGTYFFVMDVNGRIYNSGIDDPTTWTALGFTTANSEPGFAVALAKSQNYVAALKDFSTELYYFDINNVVGSPISPVQSGFTKIGCASGTSVVSMNDNIIFIAQSKQKGREVYLMRSLEQAPISTPDVERIINADDLATVHAMAMRIDGHNLYVLTLVTSNITIVYDLDYKVWSQWTSYAIGSSKSVSSITRSGTTATVTTGVVHTLNDGDPVTISGAVQSEYNGTFQISYVSTTVFTIEVTGTPASPATGTILAYPYTETYFTCTKYVNYGGYDLLLHQSNGHLYRMLPSLYRDDAAPIDFMVRTTRLDGGNTQNKVLGNIQTIGDNIADYAMVRWSDDDYVTNKKYRRLNLNYQRPSLRKCGAFRRRSLEYKFIGNNPNKLNAFELGD